MKKDLNFTLKVIRNAVILAGLYFVSVYATGDLTYEICKPIIVFFLAYIFTEMARYYGLNMSIPKNKKKGQTYIF